MASPRKHQHICWNTHYNYLHPWSHYENHNKGKVYQHVQVVISNASNCKLMSRMIIVGYLIIMWNPCVVNCLDLMVDKVGKLDQLMEEVLNVARNMVTFVIKKPKVLTMYKMHGNLESQVFNHVLCYKHPRGDKKSNKNQWLEPSHERQKGRPKKGQQTHNPHKPKKGRSQSFSWQEVISPIALLMSPTCKS